MTFEEWCASNSGRVIQWTDIWPHPSQEPYKATCSGIFIIKPDRPYGFLELHVESEHPPPIVGPNWVETFQGSKHWVQDIS